MKQLKYKTFSEGESSQLRHLSFVAGGNLAKSASRRRIALRNKESSIAQQNFIIKIKNLCIDLQNGKFDYDVFMNVSGNLNFYKKPIDDIDYSLVYVGIFHRRNVLKTFIQNNIPFCYLKMYHNNTHLIKEKI
jgi:hypothetical protein